MCPARGKGGHARAPGLEEAAAAGRRVTGTSLMEWDSKHVGAWLDGLGLQKVATVAREQEVDGKTLSKLDAAGWQPKKRQVDLVSSDSFTSISTLSGLGRMSPHLHLQFICRFLTFFTAVLVG